MQKSLHGTQNRVVIERASLHNDMFSETINITELHHFEQGIFNDRQSYARGNVADIRAFLLCLFYSGIHEYGTACTQIHRLTGVDCFLCKFLGGHTEALSEVLNKRAAACGACLV